MMGRSTDLDTAKYISLITFRKSGAPVHTAVWFAKFSDVPNTFGIITETNAGKVKRIRNNQKIEVQVCDIKGNIKLGAAKYSGTARLVVGRKAIAVRKAIAKQYGVTYRLFSIYNSVGSAIKRRNKLPETNIVITLNS